MIQNEREFYENALNGAGDDLVKAVGWRNPQRADIRYKVAVQMLKVISASMDDKNPRIIVDLGCGVGNLYEYLEYELAEKGGQIKGAYVGVEFMDFYVDRARKRFPSVQFNRGTIQEVLPNRYPGRTKIAVCLGTHSLNTGEGAWEAMLYDLHTIVGECKAGIFTGYHTCQNEVDPTVLYHDLNKLVAFMMQDGGPVLKSLQFHMLNPNEYMMVWERY